MQTVEIALLELVAKAHRLVEQGFVTLFAISSLFVEFLHAAFFVEKVLINPVKVFLDGHIVLDLELLIEIAEGDVGFPRNAPLIGSKLPDDEGKKGRFPRPVDSDEDAMFPMVQLERDVPVEFFVAVIETKVFDFEQCHDA